MERFIQGSHFTQLAIDILINHATLEEEIDGEGRKGVHQSKYVIECPEGEYWCSKKNVYKPIPKELVGFWIMMFDEDLNHMDWRQALDNMNWCKCK